MKNIIQIATAMFIWMIGLSAFARSEWALHIDTKFESIYFPEEFGTNTNTSLNKLELDPNFTFKHKDHWRFYLQATFVANPDNKSTEEQYFFDPSELYIKYQGTSLNLQIGYMTTTWGVTDGYNPLDIVNPKQYFDPLKSRKLGTPSLYVSQALSWFDWDFTYIPRNRQAVLPGTESRWLPREVYVPLDENNDLVLLLPNELRYRYADRETLDNALDNNVALRLQKHFSAVDLNFYGYSGAAGLPLIQPEVTGTIVAVSPKTVIQVDPDVTLRSNTYPLRLAGFSFVSSQWEFLFKYATSYSQSIGDDPLLPGWTHESVFAVEKTFQSTNSFTAAALQYSTLATERENDSNISISEIFRDAWMLGARIAWKEVWNISFSSLYNSRSYSSFFELGIGRRFRDRWVLTASAAQINGDALSPLGVYSKNDSYSLSLAASF